MLKITTVIVHPLIRYHLQYHLIQNDIKLIGAAYSYINLVLQRKTIYKVNFFKTKEITFGTAQVRFISSVTLFSSWGNDYKK